MSIPVPEIVSMFIPRRNRNKSKMINSINKKQKVQSEILSGKNIETNSNILASVTNIDPSYLKMKVDVVEAKQYLSEIKQSRIDLLNAFYKLLFYVFLISTLIIIGISIDAVNGNNLSCVSTNLEFSYLFIRTNLRCTYLTVNFFDIYAIYVIIIFSYLSLLLFKFIFIILINYSITLLQDEVAEIIIISGTKVNASVVMEKKGLIYKLIYNGIIKIKED